MVRPRARPIQPQSIPLPPVRVEPELHHALTRLAEGEGRTLSDVVRRGLRELVAQQLQERTR